MKKTLFVIVLVLAFQFYANAFEIAFSGKYEAGTETGFNNVFASTKMGFSFSTKYFENYIYGGYKTLMLTYPNGGFDNYFNMYMVGNKINIKWFFIDAKYCYNSKVNTNNAFYDNRTAINQEWFNNFFQRSIVTISAGFEFKLPLYKSK